MTPVSHGKPCAGNPHARFEEGASALETPRRNALLHKKETREYMRVFGIALAVMIVVPLAYRVCICVWPPKEKPRQSLEQFFKEAEISHGMELLTKPIAKWSDADAESEPEIYAWLKEQGNEILPWEWTEEAMRKDPKGCAKLWRRIWDGRKSRCGQLVASHRKEIKRLEQELHDLTTIYTHRTNQIARLRRLSATNDFPCQVSIEHLSKGRLWGWNKRVETVECKDAAAMMVGLNSICGKELATALDESKRAQALSGLMDSSRKKSILCEKLYEICDESKRLIESDALQDDVLKRALVENLKESRQ